MEKITEDMEGLEMHSAVRNVMRLFDRIKDFEKRVVARQGALSAGRQRRAAGGAARCSRSCSAPFAPHIAEELWLALGQRASAAPQTPWPGVSLQAVA